MEDLYNSSTSDEVIGLNLGSNDAAQNNFETVEISSEIIDDNLRVNF